MCMWVSYIQCDYFYRKIFYFVKLGLYIFSDILSIIRTVYKFLNHWWLLINVDKCAVLEHIEMCAVQMTEVAFLDLILLLSDCL